MDEGFEKGTMSWEKKNPSYLGNKTRGRRENVEEREKGGEEGEKKVSQTDPPSPLFPSQF